MTRIASPSPAQPESRKPRRQSAYSHEVTIWDANLGRFRTLDPYASDERLSDTAQAVAQARGIERPATDKPGTIARLLAWLGLAVPRVTSQSAAKADLARGYDQMAARFEAKGDPISAEMARACAKAIEQAGQ